MCSYAKSSKTKGGVKTNCTQTPQYRPLRIPEQSCIPNPEELPAVQKMMKKMPDGSKTICFKLLGEEGPSATPEKDYTPSILEPSQALPPPSLRTNWGTNL